MTTSGDSQPAQRLSNSKQVLSSCSQELQCQLCFMYQVLQCWMQCCVILSMTSAQLYGSQDEGTARDKRGKLGPLGWVSNAAVSLYCIIISQAHTHPSQYSTVLPASY